MENWQRGLIAGSAAAGLILMLRGRQSAGLMIAGIGVATLAAEYPAEFAEVRHNIREYVARGMTFLEVSYRLGRRIAEVSEHRPGLEWYERLLAG